MNLPFTSDSVQSVQQKAFKLSRKLNKNQDLYLFLNSPGGEIDSGELLIETLNSLPQRVDTITLFSASMAAITVESLGNRYVLPFSEIMFHPATIGGLEGQVPGQLDQRVKSVHDQLNSIETKVANRMGMDLNTYQNLVQNELWLEGSDSITAKAADKVVNVTCDKSLDGTYEQKVDTMFGPVIVTWAQCPLLVSPISIDFGRLKTDSAVQLNEVKSVFLKSIANKFEFVNSTSIQNDYFKYVQ